VTTGQAGLCSQPQRHRPTAPEQAEQSRSGDDNQGQPTALVARHDYSNNVQG